MAGNQGKRNENKSISYTKTSSVKIIFPCFPCNSREQFMVASSQFALNNLYMLITTIGHLLQLLYFTYSEVDSTMSVIGRSNFSIWWKLSSKWHKWEVKSHSVPKNIKLMVDCQQEHQMWGHRKVNILCSERKVQKGTYTLTWLSFLTSDTFPIRLLQEQMSEEKHLSAVPPI